MWLYDESNERNDGDVTVFSLNVNIVIIFFSLVYIFFILFQIANTAWGILRGLETFTHLFKRNMILNRLELIDSSSTNDIIINDQPRFKHRGILIDTARHYLSIDIIKQVIDSLVINK